MKSYSCILLLAFFFAIATESYSAYIPGPSSTGNEPITISIINSKTKKPEKGVSVRVKTRHGENKLVSDENGNLKIPYTSGEVTFVLEKRGFKTISITKKLEIIECQSIKFPLETENSGADIFHPLSRFLY